MSFDTEQLVQAVAQHGKVVRIVVVQTKGSAPRDAGTSMLVWADGQSGTIGGGALELNAISRARQALQSGDWLESIALGPGLGQCCGGAVTLLGEVYDHNRLSGVGGAFVLRRVAGNNEQPLALQQALSAHRNAGTNLTLHYLGGWLLEPVSRPARTLWLYGAGHVGRAIVNVLAPLPEFEITWVDSAMDRFPNNRPQQVTLLSAKNPADLVQHAPENAEHLVLTYSHAFDLEICHRLLLHRFKSAGVIGSKTKWTRFRKRLRTLGHTDARIDQISCPIGQPKLGKHPQAIAIGIVGTLLSNAVSQENPLQKVG